MSPDFVLSIELERFVLRTAQTMVRYAERYLTDREPSFINGEWNGWGIEDPYMAARIFDLVINHWLMPAMPRVETFNGPTGQFPGSPRTMPLRTLIAVQICEALLSEAQISRCVRPDCTNPLAGRRHGAKYCSDKCRDLINQRTSKARRRAARAG